MISGDSKRCAISTEKGCTGCNWSEDDKIGLGNCETVSKNHFDFLWSWDPRRAGQAGERRSHDKSDIGAGFAQERAAMAL